MAEYRIHCRYCGYEGRDNSRWIPFAKVQARGRSCPRCGKATDLEPWCTLWAETSVPDL